MVHSNWAATSPGKPSILPANFGERYVRSGLSPLEYSLGLRRSVCRFFSAPEPRRVIFGAGVTDLLNKLLPGAGTVRGARSAVMRIYMEAIMFCLHF